MLPIIIVIGCASRLLPVEGFLSLGRTLGFFLSFMWLLNGYSKATNLFRSSQSQMGSDRRNFKLLLFVNSQWSLATKFWGFLTGWASYAEISPAFEYSSFIQLFFYVAAALVSLSWFALLPKRKLPLKRPRKRYPLPLSLAYALNYSVGKWFAIRHTL